MAHWGGLNLDWLPESLGSSPRGGELDLRVAEAWDKMLETAEERGVYIQLVLQHHGQYSSQVNSNWQYNPWNVANGGFLKTPVEFFTSPEALRLTLLKYRTIVAPFFARAQQPHVIAKVDALIAEKLTEATSRESV